jgi:flagellar motor component MotA
MKKLTMSDFISDYQHLIVRGVSLDEIKNHIRSHYRYIELHCLHYLGLNHADQQTV